MKKCMSVVEYCYRKLAYIELLCRLLDWSKSLYEKNIIDYDEYHKIEKELINKIRTEFKEILNKVGIKYE